MRPILHSVAIRAALLPLVLIGPTAGCYGWEPLDPPYAGTIEATEPDRVRIVAAGGGFEIREPVVDGDTLRGTHVGTGTPEGVPLESIALVQRRELDTGRTIAAVAAGVLTAASVVYLVAVASWASEMH
jgi:hypothetical protein